MIALENVTLDGSDRFALKLDPPSRTNISEALRRCVGTDDRPCSSFIDATAGRLRCSQCRIDQRMIDDRLRANLRNAEKRNKATERVKLLDGSIASLHVRHVEGIAGLPRMGIARCAFTVLLVIRDGQQWQEIDEQELDRRIAEKTRKYLQMAETLMKTGA